MAACDETIQFTHTMHHYKLLCLCVLLATTLSGAVQAQDTRKLTILHTGDTHSRLEPIDRPDDRNHGQGGFVRRATCLEKLREETPELLLFDTGDFSQGTPYYTMFRGEAEVKLMNLMGYDAVGIGNHEFDCGMENMAKLFRLATFPVVCSNYDFTNTVLDGLVRPYIILERGDLLVGVLGLGVRPEGMIPADKFRGVTYRDPVAVANEMAELLKKEGCQVVVCLSHLGIESDENLVVKTRNIDIILGGHSHTFMKEPRIYLNADGASVQVMHTGRDGVKLGRIDLTLKRK